MDGSNLNYAWIIDGVRTDLANPTRNGAMGRYTFDAVGTHRIVLEVSNKDGKTVSANKDITIDSLLSVKLIASPKIGRVGSSVSLIADSREAQTFEWQFGDGETDTSTTGRVSHVYKKAGTYSVSLTVRGRNSDSNTISRKVYVMDSTNPFAIITLKRDNEDIIPTIDACDGKEAFVIDRAKAVNLSADDSVNADGTNQGITYAWKYGSRNSSQKNFSYKFDELGCFPVTLTVRSQKTGEQDTMKSFVKVENLAPKFSSLSVTADKLESDPVTVTVTANNAVDEDGAIVSYIWYYYTAEDPEPQDFRVTRSPKTVFVLPRIGAKYYFAVILEDSNGLKINSDDVSTERYSLTLASDNINTPIISLKTSNTSVSVGQKVDFTVAAKNILGTDLAGKAEYKWDYNGDGFYEETTSTPTVSHVYDKPGSFNFKVKVTYKGISNTKYQTITVKNKIQPNLEYIAIGKKFIFLNTTKGFYTKAKWTLGDVISTTPDSFVYDFGDEQVSGELTLEVSDGSDTKSTSTTLRRDVLNALKVKRSTDKLIYFSYPAADNDTIHITDPSEKLSLYLGESKGGAAKYGIDTDILVDSNLNGDPADDMDNKGTDSSVNGSVFTLKSFDVSAKEKTMRLSLYDANNAVIATKDIKVVYDFVDGTVAETLSGTTADALPKDISETDKINLEKLKDMIRSAKDQDRLKMMQFFAQLQENWFDTREKTKTIIDFENYIDASSALDAKTKEAFYSLLEGFLLADTQVKDDIALAVKVLKSLIPKTNPSYAQIMKNIDDILSHPTNTTLNKELGIFILNAIKDDTTIETKDKTIIKSQLQVIIYGGQNNIPKDAPAAEDVGTSGGVLDFLIGFGKVLGFIILLLLGLVLTLFTYFKVFNKDNNLGFQDFIIDRISGKHSTPTPPVSVATTPVPKAEKPPVDVLANITPDHPIMDRRVEESPVVSPEPEPETTPSLVEENTTIPDWLKQSTSLDSEISSGPQEDENSAKVHSPEQALETTEDTQDIFVPVPTDTESIVPESADSGIPDWLKGMSSETVFPESVSEEKPVGEVVEQEILPQTVSTTESELPAAEPSSVSDQTDSVLPAWMQGMDQVSLKQEVEEEIKSTPAPVRIKEVPHEDIPDWLRSTPIVSTESVIESPEVPKIPETSQEEASLQEK